MHPHAQELWRGPRWLLAVLLALLGMVGPFSIDTYLPAKMGEAEIKAAIEAAVAETGASGPADTLEQADALAEIETRDNGKLIKEMRAQMRALPDSYTYFSGMADKLLGDLCIGLSEALDPQVLSKVAPAIDSQFTPNLSAFTTAFAYNDYNVAAAQAVLIAVVAFVLSFVFLRLTNREDS